MWLETGREGYKNEDTIHSDPLTFNILFESNL